ncbi:MAG TPA: hypothetical protein VFY26_16175 [Anaerolineales bacterium]|nr:hypothetical protein [Anaerolineales bacterium]
MKKLLMGLLLLIAACQPTATPTPVAPLLATATVPPTPIPFTETPAPTSTPELSPTPFPRFFTTEFDSTLEGWAILQAGNDAVPNVTVENSRLLVQMDSHFTWIYSLYGAQEYDNVRLSTTFVNNAMTPASAGLVCRYSDSDGWLEYNVSSDGTYNVLYGKWLANGIANYMPILEGVSNQIQQSGMEQQIGLICSGPTLTLLIGDTVIRNADVSRFGLGSGRVGVTAAAYENTPVIVSFDWLNVGEP